MIKITDLQVRRTDSKSQPFGVKIAGDLKLTPKELLGVYGPNGAGKTSLMKGLAGLVPASQRSGQLRIGEESFDLTNLRSDWGRTVLYLGSDFQSPFRLSLVELFEMAAAVSMGGIHLELGPTEHTRIALVTEAMSLTSELSRTFQDLSDGEKQWVMIARALIQRPKLLLLDETCSKLDLDRLVQLSHLLKSSLFGGMCIWMSAHDLQFLARVSSSILLIERGGYVTQHPGGTAAIENLVERVFPGVRVFT